MLKNIKIIFLLFLAGSTALVWYAVFYFETHQNLRITFFDVGQGDSIFIEIPGGNQILIDGGPNDAILSKLGRAMPFWDKSIDLLILTHPHADHLSGLLSVLKRYRVGMVLESGVEHSIPEYQEWRRALEEKQIKRVVAEVGQMVHAGSSTELFVLAPLENFDGVSRKNVHDGTVITRLAHGENSILFMGDAEKHLEFKLLDSSLAWLDVDILKVGHHGSKTSSYDAFLHAVSPEYAIIQSGRKNRYGHPTQEVLDRLAAVGATILRNDLSGDIMVESNGSRFMLLK